MRQRNLSLAKDSRISSMFICLGDSECRAGEMYRVGRGIDSGSRGSVLTRTCSSHSTRRHFALSTRVVAALAAAVPSRLPIYRAQYVNLISRLSFLLWIPLKLFVQITGRMRVFFSAAILVAKIKQTRTTASCGPIVCLMSQYKLSFLSVRSMKCGEIAYELLQTSSSSSAREVNLHHGPMQADRLGL